MTNTAVDNLSKAAAESVAHSGAATKKILEAGAAGLSDSQHKAESVLKKSAAALGESGHSSMTALQQLAEAYQQIASKNSARLTESIKELAQIKNPVDFAELQQKLVKEAFESALADSKHIADITVSVFTSALEPLNKAIAAAQHATPK